MSTDELAALAALTFNWTRTLNDVWAPARFHVEGLHAEVAHDISRAIAEAATGEANPLGLVLEGQRGVGKTHLLGWTREQVQQAGGYFFLVGDLSAKAFWEELLGCVLEQLLPLPDGSRDQLHTLLNALADRTGLDPVIRDAVTGQTTPSPVSLKVFIRELRRIDPRIGLICQDTARALVLLASPDTDDQDVGYYFMTGNEVDQEDRRRWSINATRSVPRLLITELSRLLALTGPTVIAVDQIDALIDDLVRQSSDLGLRSPGLSEMGTGLMTLRDRTFRTLTIVSALPESWDAIHRYGTDAVVDRFGLPRQLKNIPSADIGRLMIEKRFRADYTRVGFDPPYPTWPILPAAFSDASRYTARALLKRVEAHVGACLRERTVLQLKRLDFESDAEPVLEPATAAAGPASLSPDAAGAARDEAGGGADDLAVLDARFAELRAAPDTAAVVAAALDPATEDTAMPTLLAAGLEAWVRELGGSVDHPFAQDPPPGKNPRLHASLRLVLDARTERHRRWAFRAVAAGHPRAVQARLRKAAEASGLDAGRPERHLFVLRNGAWPKGKVTEQETTGLESKGGVVLPVPPADLATFAALAELIAERHPALNAWLADRKPAHASEVLAIALWDVAEPPQAPAVATFTPKPSIPGAQAQPDPVSDATLLAAEIPAPPVPALWAPVAEVPAAELPGLWGPEAPLPAAQAPETQVPVTRAPLPHAWETRALKARLSETRAQETRAQETRASDTRVPETRAPETRAPETRAPRTRRAGARVSEGFRSGARSAEARPPGAWAPETRPVQTPLQPEAAPSTAVPAQAAPPPAIHIGLPGAGRPGATLGLAALRRHVAIFAGSGSGKTVLLRRVIEECALQGVSSIVLDPNNDLARLGDQWPAPPEPWLSDDPERSARYLAETDVVVWTPRRASGRPLTFRPLPDFGAVIDEVDEFDAAVDAAVEALAPRVGAQRATARATQEKAVLTEAMRYFARGAGHDLGAFIDLLSTLPGHVSGQSRAVSIAGDLADRLRAARATDPLFGGIGEPADPGLLLTPPPGKRARISVISMVGMVGLDQWQGFVNQLQMALFSWIKRNPADNEPLKALLVMDEAQDLVPSSGLTACSESTRRLASQARKYGLGLLFATQSPKALHNSIPGNSTTQFFGLLNAPAQIDAAREIAKAKGGDVPAVSRLIAGEFYLATEGSGFRQVHTPMCLSYHPSSPLNEDEVLERAAASGH